MDPCSSNRPLWLLLTVALAAPHAHAAYTTTYILISDGNRLAAATSAEGETRYTYDATGNLIQDNEHTYSYDARNRLTEIDGGEHATYTYNPQGQRIHKRALTAILDHDEEAQRLEQEAARLKEQAQAADRSAIEARQAAQQARRQIQHQRHEAERHQRQATQLETRADAYDAQAEAHRRLAQTLTAAADEYRRHRLEDPQGRQQRRLDRILERAIAWAEKQAERQLFKAELDDQRAQWRRIRAAELRSEADTLLADNAHLQPQAEADQRLAEQQRAAADDLRRQARDARKQARHHARLARAGAPPERRHESRRYLYDGWRLLGEYNSDGTPIQESVWFEELPIATRIGTTLYRIQTDHLGAPRRLLDDDGTVVWKWVSDPYGVGEADRDPDRDGTGIAYGLRLPGQLHDAETGRYYNHFRDYDPRLGRYLQSDPIGLDGGGIPMPMF